MSIVEIILIIAGAVICILGYLMPAKKEDMDETLQLIGEDEVRKVVDKEVGEAKTHISDIIDETVSYAIEKTERSMERVTNEKIMAVNEYSDTVLEEINKNHKEVLFLYDMLNDKHDNLKATVAEASRTAEEIKQTVKDAEITARETQESVKGIEGAVRDAEDAVRAVMTAALEARGQNAGPVYAEIAVKESARDSGASNVSIPEFEKYVPEIGTPVFERNARESGMPVFERNIQESGTPVFEQNIRESRTPVFERNAQESGTPVFERSARESGVPEFEGIVPDIGVPEFAGEVPDIGMPEFSGDSMDDVVEEPDREAAYAEAVEVARAASFTGRREYFQEAVYEDQTQIQEEDQFVPIAPPRVEIIHDPDSEYDYVAEPQQEPWRTQVQTPLQERSVDNRPFNIQFLNGVNGKNSGRNSNERILELHKAGKSNMAIAKELGLGIGEVKLVIDLFEGL